MKEYGQLSKLLHRVALGRMPAELSFDIEQQIHGKKTRERGGDKHVFVSGLARAGTTILMRLLHESGQFRSLTYRDMPFPLAPGLWRNLSQNSQKKSVDRERAHADGLEHGYDSPEALEEVFWRVFCGKSYIGKGRLVPMTADAEVLSKFRAYINVLLKEAPDQRYLSKNNNNILRLPSVAAAFPNAVILVPFRDPLQHAHSLQRQHGNFLKQHAEDSFSLEYMDLLAHHEFGRNQKPFVYDSAYTPPADRDSLDYWLSQWVHVYSRLSDSLPEQAVFVCYEDLCAAPQTTWPKICKLTNIPAFEPDRSLRQAKTADVEPRGASLQKDALELYDSLRAKALAATGG